MAEQRYDTHDRLAVVGVRETDADGLVNEEYVRVRSPGLLKILCRCGVHDSARSCSDVQN